MNAPIDNTHSESVEAINQIRRDVRAIREGIRAWEPRPMPKGWS